jgi:hypothetical protein
MFACFQTRWYTYLEQQANLDLKRRQEDRAYQLQLLQILTSVISTKTSQSSLPINQNCQIDKLIPKKQDEQLNRGEKRSCSPIPTNEEKKSKIRQSLPPNFYSLLAQIHNINNTDQSS